MLLLLQLITVTAVQMAPPPSWDCMEVTFLTHHANHLHRLNST